MVSSICVLLPALLLGALASDETAVALESDDQCDERDTECSLTMLQLRGQKGQEASGDDRRQGSCQTYKCSPHYHRYRSCQCNPGCEEHGNCCHDYVELCVGGCQHYGCGASYSGSHACQCNADCVEHHSCCPDYEATCFGMGTPEAATSPAAPAPMPGHTGRPAVAGHPIAGKQYPTYPGFTLHLVEEFEEPIDLDNDPIWTWSDGGLIEGQVRFVKEAITFPQGKMRIEVSKDLNVWADTCSNAEVDQITPKGMTSGEMRTKHNMFRYGRYEASIRAPMVQPHNGYIDGNYVSTMFVFRDAKYKHWREIDFEITGDHSDSVTTNVLSAENTTKWSKSIAESQAFRLHQNLRTNFHTFAFEWLPDRISWYFDGRLIREKRGGHVPISDLSAKIMMNLWVFDHRYAFGGPKGNNNHYPMYSEYDWFRFYKWDGEHDYPCPGFGTSCLTRDDEYLSSNNPCDGIAQIGTVYGKEPCHATCHDRRR